MSYLAIARKYRPATFAEMVGQDHVTRTLANAIRRGRIHHAYLFCGARGVGKTTAARALARALNCTSAAEPTPEPCGVCGACTALLAGNSPDMIEIDGASNNSVDNIRELRDTVRYPPQGRYKIYLIDEVHMLSTAAFNALLKTLEEPPPQVVFLFATTEPQKIPDTILSRVQRFDFRRIGATGVVERLAEIAAAEGSTVDEAGLRLIARAGEGSMRDSQSLLDKVLSFASADHVTAEEVADTLGLVDQRLVREAAAALLGGEPAAALEAIARVHELGFELADFTAALLDTLRDATFLRLSPSVHGHVDLADDDKAALLALTEGVSPDALTRLFHAVLDVHDRVARAARPRIVLEMAVARLTSVAQAEPLSAALSRLEDVERRLRQAGGRGGRAPEPSRSTAHRQTPRAEAHGDPLRRPRPAPRVAPAATAAERWEALRTALLALDPPATALAEAMPTRGPRLLTLTVAPGRGLAEARRRAADPDLQALVAACYGADVRLVLEEALARPADTALAALEAEVRRDPAARAVMSALGGRLIGVQPWPAASGEPPTS